MPSPMSPDANRFHVPTHPCYTRRCLCLPMLKCQCRVAFGLLFQRILDKALQQSTHVPPDVVGARPAGMRQEFGTSTRTSEQTRWATRHQGACTLATAAESEWTALTLTASRFSAAILPACGGLCHRVDDICFKPPAKWGETVDG